MNKNIIIGIAVVVVLGSALLMVANLFTTQSPVLPSNDSTPPLDVGVQSQATQASTTASKNISVKLTDNGFEPKSVTIELGATVVWTNTTSRPMWVASDPHPTHSIFSDFDARTRVPQGETYSFTFTKEGSWEYHNHVNAGQTGIVMVN